MGVRAHTHEGVLTQSAQDELVLLVPDLCTHGVYICAALSSNEAMGFQMWPSNYSTPPRTLSSCNSRVPIQLLMPRVLLSKNIPRLRKFYKGEGWNRSSLTMRILRLPKVEKVAGRHTMIEPRPLVN